MDQLCRRTMIFASTWHGWIVPRSAAVVAILAQALESSLAQPLCFFFPVMAAASYLTIGEDDGWLLHYLLRKAEEKGAALAQRTWCLGSSVTEPFAVNNGLCEGI